MPKIFKINKVTQNQTSQVVNPLGAHMKQGDVELGNGASLDGDDSANVPPDTSATLAIGEDAGLHSWQEKERTNSCSSDYKWNDSSVIRNRIPSGRGQDTLRGFNTARKYESLKNADALTIFKKDWFHGIVESAPYKIFTILILYYVISIFFFSLFWRWAGSNNDPCSTGIHNFTDAFYFSLITMTTIGYGANSLFFNSCSSVSIIIIFESFASVVFNAIILGICFGKLQRGATRAVSICFSKNAIMRNINGKPYFQFRVVEQRKLQLVEAHVRCYAIYHARGGHKNEVQLFQHQPLRLNHPNDELGGMLLLMLPSTVVHEIDAWSPLLPPSCRPKSNGSSMNTHTWPDVHLRRGDFEQGQSSLIECAVSGEQFSTERGHQLNHEFNNIPYPCDAVLTESAADDVISSMEQYFKNCEMEILVLVEGIDPTMSTTLQACYSYKSQDIKFGTHDFSPCVFRDTPYDSGRPAIDYVKFHELEEMNPIYDSHVSDKNQ